MTFKSQISSKMKGNLTSRDCDKSLRVTWD